MMLNGKDSFWLQLEVCREYQRSRCNRADGECKFAHPPTNVEVQANGRVTACYDSIKGRCQRESCKYMHPPAHLKDQLLINGRNHLALKNAILHQAQQHQNPFTHLMAAAAASASSSPPSNSGGAHQTQAGAAAQADPLKTAAAAAAALAVSTSASPPAVQQQQQQQQQALFQSALAMAQRQQQQQQFAAAAAAAAAMAASNQQMRSTTTNGAANGAPTTNGHNQAPNNHHHHHHQQAVIQRQPQAPQQQQPPPLKGFDLSSMPQTSPAAALAAAFAASTMNPFMGNPFAVPTAQSYASQYAAAASALAAAVAAAANQQQQSSHMNQRPYVPSQQQQYRHNENKPQQQAARHAPNLATPSGAEKRRTSPAGSDEELINKSSKRVRVTPVATATSTTTSTTNSDTPTLNGANCDRHNSERAAGSLGGSSPASGSGRESESPGTATEQTSSTSTSSTTTPNSKQSNAARNNGLPLNSATKWPLHDDNDDEPQLEICREFLRNNCRRGELECRFAHPRAHQLRAGGHASAPTTRSANELHVGGSQFVTVCKDFLRSKCLRAATKCRYLHPASHLLTCKQASTRKRTNCRSLTTSD